MEAGWVSCQCFFGLQNFSLWIFLCMLVIKNYTWKRVAVLEWSLNAFPCCQKGEVEAIGCAQYSWLETRGTEGAGPAGGVSGFEQQNRVVCASCTALGACNLHPCFQGHSWAAGQSRWMALGCSLQPLACIPWDDALCMLPFAFCFHSGVSLKQSHPPSPSCLWKKQGVSEIANKLNFGSPSFHKQLNDPVALCYTKYQEQTASWPSSLQLDWSALPSLRILNLLCSLGVLLYFPHVCGPSPRPLLTLIPPHSISLHGRTAFTHVPVCVEW